MQKESRLHALPTRMGAGPTCGWEGVVYRGLTSAASRGCECCYGLTPAHYATEFDEKSTILALVVASHLRLSGLSGGVRGPSGGRGDAALPSDWTHCGHPLGTAKCNQPGRASCSACSVEDPGPARGRGSPDPRRASPPEAGAPASTPAYLHGFPVPQPGYGRPPSGTRSRRQVAASPARTARAVLPSRTAVDACGSERGRLAGVGHPAAAAEDERWHPLARTLVRESDVSKRYQPRTPRISQGGLGSREKTVSQPVRVIRQSVSRKAGFPAMLCCPERGMVASTHAPQRVRRGFSGGVPWLLGRGGSLALVSDRAYHMARNSPVGPPLRAWERGLAG